MKFFTLGFFCLSLLLGYVAAASASPVVSSFLPALVGVAISILTALTIRKEAAKPDQAPVADAAYTSLASTAHLRFGGILLLLFVVGFIFGSILGALSRSHQWFTRSSIRKEFPWDSNHTPPSTELVLCWISIEGKMLDAGFKIDQVRDVYNAFAKQYADANGNPGQQQNLVAMLHIIALKEQFLHQPSQSQNESIYQGE
jgi:hypothetical protein